MLVVAAAGLVLASSATAVTGDPAAIAHMEKVATGYGKLPGARATETGMFFLHYNGGTSVDYRWGADPPPGFKPAKATIDYWLSDGQIVGYLATVKSPKIPTLRILVAAGNVFTSTSKCWERADEGSAPFGTGDRYLAERQRREVRQAEAQRRHQGPQLSLHLAHGHERHGDGDMTPGKTPKMHSKIVLKGKSS